MPTLFWDFETRSAVSLEEVGAWRYAADQTTEVLCVGYAIDNADPQIWVPGDPVPAAARIQTGTLPRTISNSSEQSRRTS
jgi:hypothetical protein